MTSNEVLTFKEALAKAETLNNQYPDYKGMNVLLANGFSIACCQDIFMYDKLFDTADFSKEINNVFCEFGTFDFEKIIKKLNDTSKIVNIYNPESAIVQQLELDANKIKDELVNAISKKHPIHQHIIPDYKFCSAYRFLSNFEKIFTLNYDMLLYWVLMYKERSNEILDYLKIANINNRDGFGRLPDDEDFTWYKTKKQNIFYLHGALHIFDNDYDIVKAETSSEENLMDIIKEYLKNNQYPLIVAEGSSKEKLNKISHNKYLQNALDNLRYVKGNLFIHGHSLDENDKHIFDAINSFRNLKQIFISVFEPEKNFEQMQQEALSLFIDGQHNPKDIFFYDAESANVWESISEKDFAIADYDLYTKNGGKAVEF